MAGAWIELFKAGTHTSGNGVTKTYTDDDIAHIAKTYNDQKDHEAPLVIGHPETNGPAHGWAKELKVAGGKLLGYVDQVADSVVEAVNRGEYKKVSIAIYPSGLLRHIGLLGAMPPAVKGLASVQFSEDMEFEEYVWATDEYRVPSIARILSGIRDFIIDKFDLATADKIMTQEALDSLRTPAASKMITVDDNKRIVPPESIMTSPPGAITNYSEQEEVLMDELKAQIKVLEDRLAAQATAFAESQTKTSEQLTALTALVESQAKEFADKTKLSEQDQAKVAFLGFCEDLVRDGKVLPAEKDSLIEEYADLIEAEEVLTFAENKIRPSEKMKTRLAGRPVIIGQSKPFATAARSAHSKTVVEGIPAEFAELADRIDPSSLDLDKSIKEYAEKNKVSYEDAAVAFAASK